MANTLTVSEAARELGVDRQRVHQFIKEGRLPARKVEAGAISYLTIKKSDLDRFKAIPRPPGPKKKID